MKTTNTYPTVFPILFSIAGAHFVNDLLQSVIPSVYPIMKERFHLSFAQIGMITFTFQLTASLLQPFVGIYTDRNPKPFSLIAGMLFTVTGIVMLSHAENFYSLLFAAALVGLGSSVFHPEASRVAHLASGGRKGLAQSIFQLGGNAGSAFGPLLVALIVITYGLGYIMWFTVAGAIGIALLFKIGRWYKDHLVLRAQSKNSAVEIPSPFPRKIVIKSIIILLVLVFSKYIYMTSMTSYFTFYMINKFGITTQQSQVYLFAFLGSVAAGTLIGGPLGDRFGRKYIIWFSILGAAPFTMMLPYANLFWTGILAVLIGVIIASAFSAILVFAQELIPGKVGMVSGLFFGFAFGIAGIGSAFLGKVADTTGIIYVFEVCSFLPLIGVIAGLLPSERKVKN